MTALRVLAALVLLGLPGAAAITVTPGADPTTFVLAGPLVTPDQVVDGKLVIRGTQIVCAGADCAEPPGATRFAIRDAWIFPGFIDAHNHVAYNVLGKFNPPKLYQNRGQWQGAKEYKAFKQPYSVLKDEKKLACEMIKYGEIKALLSGITTIQGTSPGSECIRTLIRNAENQNELGVGASHIRTYILDISSFKPEEQKMDFSVTRSFVVHLAEGIDAQSRAEFATLKKKGLLAAQTAIIHGTAFDEAEFQEMGQAGAKLIWSPQSNLALYGKTTNIPLALKHGVSVSLAVDWNPTGSDTIFDELRVAAQVNREQFSGAIRDADWIRMITTNPARALALDDKIGRLAPGFSADVTVLAATEADPGRSLLRSHLQDVEMVWVGGELLYGNAGVLDRVKPGQCEPLIVHGSNKQVCVKDNTNPVEKSSQTRAEIQKLLQAGFPGLAPLVQ